MDHLKRSGETAFTRYDVIGWGGDEVIQRNYALPDGLWYGSQPKLMVDHRGERAEAMIGQIEAAINPPLRAQLRAARLT